MSTMTKLQINGFRRLHSLELEMRPLVVLVGANGVGKTSLLDALGLLTLSARGMTDAGLAAFGSLPNMLTRGRADDLAIETEVLLRDKEVYHYRVLLRPTSGGGYSIAEEKLALSTNSENNTEILVDSRGGDIRYLDPVSKVLVQPSWDHDRRETFVGKSHAQFRRIDEFRRYLDSTIRYHVLDISQRAPIKYPQQLRPASLPGPNGEDIVSFLHYLREDHPGRYETILDTLHAAFRSFVGFGFPSVGAGMFTLTWKDKNFGGPLYLNELSEGTLRFLWLVSLLNSPTLPAITMIDEPEVSLHPELLSLFVDLMREASRRTQLVVATHSDRLISFLRPEEVVTMDIGEDGLTTASWADTMGLDNWLDEFSLDEVWRMGRIGGRS